jgi:glycosyltransferase involved in cell wall biosynthesis
MKIAQIAPLHESCPPQLYGGTERVVSYLTEELVRQGHQVTLFASGDSRTAAELCAPCPRALRLDPKYQDPLVHHMVMLSQVARRADEFDVLHFHIDYLHFPLFADRGRNTLTTTHGRLDIPDLAVLFRAFANMPLVSISDSQRRPVAWASWCGTVHHGLPPDLYAPGSGDGGYLAFIGRISPEKRPDWAIEIARRAGMPLAIAAKIDKNDYTYYKSQIEPLLKNPLVEFLGEIGEDGKGAFLGDATAVLFPIDWPEPFGLSMIEAMANGTPVIAFRRGSVPEVIDHGITGFVVDTIEEAVAAVPLAKALDRTAVRQRFEERFSVGRMAGDYVALYRARLARAAVASPSIANDRSAGTVTTEAAEAACTTA